MVVSFVESVVEKVGFVIVAVGFVVVKTAVVLDVELLVDHIFIVLSELPLAKSPLSNFVNESTATV